VRRAGRAPEPPRPDPHEDDQGDPAPDYRRRRVVVALVAVVAVVAAGLGVRALLADDGDGGGGAASDRAPFEGAPVDAAVVLEDLRASPCDLLQPVEVEGVVQRPMTEPEDSSGICSYGIEDDAVGVVSIQVFGPMTADGFDGLAAEGVDLAGTTPAARWLAEAGGGRALARDGAVVVELTVRVGLADEGTRAIAQRLIELATDRVPPNERTDIASTGSAGDGCPFLDEDAAELLADFELQPVTNPDVCSYRTTGGSTTVELIDRPTVPLADIRRSSGEGGEVAEWPREEVDVADGGVWLVPPGGNATSGELYASVGPAMLHVTVSQLDLAGARERAIAIVEAYAK
jgi:hypothetical protein